MLKKDLEIQVDKLYLIYTILRRAITGRTEPKNKVFSIQELRSLCHEIEHCNVKDLGVIHKKWIGY